MFKKPKRNFRRKVADSDSDQENENKADDQEETNNGEEPMEVQIESVLQEKKVKKKKRDKDGVVATGASKINPLSFDHEEDADTEIFRVKKSSHSKRIAKQLKKESLKEKVVEEKEESTKVEDDAWNNKQSSEENAEEKLQRLREEIRTLNGDDDDDESDDDGQHVFREMLARGEIPDARTIHMIRKQRQMKRELGDEIIPLEESDANKNSRLVRDDENDRSDDEEEERIDFSVNTAARERQKIRDDFLAAEHGSDNEGSDKEVQEWEAQQIRKAVIAIGVPQVCNSQDGMGIDPGNSNSMPPDYSLFANEASQAQSGFGPFKPMSKITDLSQITMETIRKRLQERLDSMDEVYRSHSREREKLATDINDTESSIASCEGQSGDLEERFRFFQEMRGYVRDLVECLNEKVPTINELETRLLNLLRNRADKLLHRRQQDVRDQCQDYMTNKASSQVVMETSEEFERQRRVAEREARRSRRRRAREAKNISGHRDGLSSDDEESQSDISKFNMEKDLIMQTADQLFEDVVEDFSELDSIRSQFEKWKFNFGDTYKEAYIGLCLPKLLNPFIRLQLLRWNPLDGRCQDFEETQWYNCLVFLGFRDEEATVDRNDDDIRTLPAIVDKILLPKLTNLVELVWDPLSTTQTSRLVNLIQRLIRDYPTIHGEGKNTQSLLKAAVDRMRKTLDDDVFMPMYPKTVLESRSAGPAVFFHRQSWTCIKLLGNFLSVHGILANKVLQQLALEGLLNRYIILSLHNSFPNREAFDKCQAIISTFPKSWFSELEADKTIPQLENLCRYLLSYADILHKNTIMAKDAERLEAREQIKQISKLLVSIHALNHAVFMSNQYSFKIS